MPEIVDAALHYIKLAILMLLKALAKHPLLELTIEHKPLCVKLGEELWYLSVLLNKHHGIAS